MWQPFLDPGAVQAYAIAKLGLVVTIGTSCKRAQRTGACSEAFTSEAITTALFQTLAEAPVFFGDHPSPSSEFADTCAGKLPTRDPGCVVQRVGSSARTCHLAFGVITPIPKKICGTPSIRDPAMPYVCGISDLCPPIY